MTGIVTIGASLIVVSSVFDTITHLSLKLGLKAVASPAINFYSVVSFLKNISTKPYVWIGISSSLCSLAFWILALTTLPLSFAFSIDSLHHVFIAGASYFVLRENMNRAKVLGTLCIIFGVLIVGCSR